MPATRASKRSAAKTRRGLDASPSIRTRSQTHRDRLCELLLKLDPATITRVVKVLETYGQERSNSQSLAQWDQLVVKHLGSRSTVQVTSKVRSPATSRSKRGGNSGFVLPAFKKTATFGSRPVNFVPFAFNTTGAFGSSTAHLAPSAFNTASAFGSSATNTAPAAFNTPRPFGWSASNNAPTAFNTSSSGSNTSIDNANASLRALFASSQDINRFKKDVLIVKGDIGSITKLGSRKIDGIAFPTASSLQNSGVGAAAAVFRRAGNELSTHVQGFSYFVAGAVRVTPGFGAGVDKLIHAVGPSSSTPQCNDVLESTYMNVMEAAQRENLKCLAVASISTGNHGVSCKDGARAALRATLRFMPKEKWSGVVGIVCYEQQVFDAFTQEKQAMLDAFDSNP